MGGWGKIKNKDHLSPAEAETGDDLANISVKTLEFSLTILHPLSYVRIDKSTELS